MSRESSIDALINSLDQKDDFLKTLLRSISTIEMALDSYGVQSLVTSFNGGKDACLIFQLVRYVMLKRHQGDKFGCDGGLGVLYFAQPAVEFPEILELMETYRGAYGVQYLEYTCSFKDGMKALVERPPPAVPVKGVFLGVRRGDPGTDSISADNIHKSDHFQASSADWPVFMRIYPVLDWSYEQVWRFMRTCELPYCSLYDVGYTSIGNINNTVPNKALEMEVESGAERRYRPAYELEDPSLERCNRVSKPGGKS